MTTGEIPPAEAALEQELADGIRLDEAAKILQTSTQVLRRNSKLRAFPPIFESSPRIGIVRARHWREYLEGGRRDWSSPDEPLARRSAGEISARHSE